ncbi:MAG: cysteine--tRNA ligase [Bacteroidales bacterium]|jgi:cysteinyl-tRNA synthetase|nr:cysteine--tRNA ligase [Bacteroidales bacterium]
MNNSLFIYNTLSRRKELFEPLSPPYTGMYVCGPTVYGDAHLGHARPAITFDLVFRYLKHKGYKVRYVRNITDVGHLENDADEGEDKIGKKARLEQLEPMEVVQYYANRYHHDMELLNVLPPSIEPHASGHIIEQIEMIERILENGYAYIINGSVYFDVVKYNQEYPYGILSGRRIDELLATTRELDGQEEKRNSVDFALWKKASPEHIMKWPSPWSLGFPGWHLECSAMGKKYLGDQFDIHGGGLDLMFPHHECEIAQSQAADRETPVRYWMHNNLITIEGQKMGKSLGNFITLEQLFSGDHPKLEKAYSPMNIRFFILQAHYRSPLDFSNAALQAAEKGMRKLLEAGHTLEKLQPDNTSDSDINALKNKLYEAMDDDFNSPIAISHLFEVVRIINSVNDKKETITAEDLTLLKQIYNDFVYDILGLQTEMESGNDSELIDGLIQMIIDMRLEARKNKDWAASDAIRDKLSALNVQIKDGKDGTTWNIDK